MSPVTHVLISWSAASLLPLSKKDRILVTLAGLIPDFDGLGLLWDLASRDSLHSLWSRFHHILGHNLAFGLGLSLATMLVATRRWMTALAVFAIFHLHLLGDLLGARAPDEIWTIPYLLPFSAQEFSWSGQWPLTSWQNFLITVVFLFFALYQTWRQGHSPLEAVSGTGDAQLVAALRARFGTPLPARLAKERP